ncbi:GNAT family N-acetyltransferase [Catelliglobosispora koreensis]|uniref:GNAT family N-acetyltransferase n=1 Tax=Catelliglobosispora koreensis TaxID=129052 RepID=UPI000375B25C|nr:GNAT family N-acetyltransferase [Catelliglobosispora koreensis]
MEMIFRAAGFADLDARTLYGLLKLRTDVFVVEQQCAYPELDGRDLEEGTRHLWFERDRTPIAYLRILTDYEENGPVARIGRVVTAKDARGLGLAGKLMVAALAASGDRPIVLEAQSEVAGFYERYGFHATGPEYLDDGIPHIPMRRELPS